MSTRSRWWPLALLLGCQSYQAQPLVPEEILADVVEERRAAAERPAVTLDDATIWMRRYNPRIRDAQASFETAQGVADTPTPLPNPTLGLVPIFTDVASLGGNRWGGDVALGWTFLLANKRKLTDDLNAVRADAARVELGAVEREEFLELRDEYIALAMADRLVDAQRRVRDVAGRSRTAIRRAVDAGSATVLDLAQFDLEYERIVVAGVEVEERERAARFVLAARAGVEAGGFAAPAFPALPDDVPELDELRDRMLRDHPGLARLRAAYAVAEKELRLEVARQYPDLEIGGLYQRDEGDNKYGLGIGIELPFFDRNQPGIARATRYRDEVRTNFRSEVRRNLVRIEEWRMRLELRRQRLRAMRDTVRPQAERTGQLANAGLGAGAADPLVLLTVLRRSVEFVLELLEAEAEVYEAWTQLERACGSPLLLFPTEKEPS
ncbi:MAG: TolC family protein [Planctomycetota bacterium]